MPFMKNGKRDYQKEKVWDHTHKGGKRLKDRVKRVQARREMEKKDGNKPSSMHVDHKKGLLNGGTNAKSNLRWTSAKENLTKEARRKRNAR